MKRKSKSSKQKRSSTTSTSQVDKWIGLLDQQMMQKDYEGAITNGERLLNFLTKQAPQRAKVLGRLGTAHAMLQNYPQSFEALTEALSLDPNSAELWYNRGLSSRFTLRFGRSYHDFERAVALNKREELKKQFEEALQFSHEMAEKSIKLRGSDFTLDQLIEQEDLFQRGLKLMEAGKWDEAGQAFQASIDMGDCLPQPWGNLGICLMMQERYDEAEAALKRALDIDPQYTIAKDNLAMLSESRRSGPPDMVRLNEPFKDSKIKQSITIIRE
jgi:tetratricopeptide (TPR) repeat protein